MYSQCGSCPKCGAPIYVPSVWFSITPPPVSYSCSCIEPVSTRMWVSTTTSSK